MRTAKEMKKLKLGLACVLVIIVSLFSATEDRFQKLIDQQVDSDVAEQLEDFRKKGIEISIDHQNYDPEKVIEKAESYLGVPARMGGTSKKGMDCSGLVMMAHRSCDIEFPHNAEEQARYGEIVPTIEKLERGDLVFFYGTYSGSRFITHTGIYIGDNEFIHTSSSKGVTVSKIDDPYYWKERFVFGTRL
jgi:lipoprotein Spr